MQEADVLLHVVDVSHPEASKQSAAVFRVLNDISVSESIPMVTVWNKLDACADSAAVVEAAAARPDTVAVSAATGANLEELKTMIERTMERSMVAFEAVVPYTNGAVLSELRSHGVLRTEEYANDGVHVVAAVRPALLGQILPYVQRELSDDEARRWRDGGEGEASFRIAESDGTGGEYVAAAVVEGQSGMGGDGVQLPVRLSASTQVGTIVESGMTFDRFGR
jgi:hypothetical protein